MASKPPSPDDPTVASADDSVVPEPDEKRLANAANRSGGDKPSWSSPADDDDEDEHDVEDDEDDEELVVFTAKEAAGALATIYAFVKPFLKHYKKIERDANSTKTHRALVILNHTAKLMRSERDHQQSSVAWCRMLQRVVPANVTVQTVQRT